jgi:ABC-2 type transport system ATP-binding protein
MTVRENLEFTANIYEMNNVKQAVDEALVKLGLDKRANQLVGTLSGGWKQRLALAACILHKPEILLLDEPTAGVDPKARREFWDELGRLSDEGMTILVSTHYMDEAERCHELVYIAYGNLMVKGTVDKVIEKTELKTLELKGNNLPLLQNTLEQNKDITTMSLFGGVLRICGEDEQKLINIIAPYQKQYNLTWQPTNTYLEDAFIYYLKKAMEN